MFFKFFEKTQLISLHWFAAQQQSSSSRRQKFYLFPLKFSSFNELSLIFQNQMERTKKIGLN